MKHTEEYIYCGIPTFMASPFVELIEAKKYDVAIIGVPIDFGASYRQGARHAPRRIREYSFWDRVDGGSYYNLDSGEEITANSLNICDLGDINIWPTNPEKNQEEVISVVSAIRKTTFPLILGGDHSVTYSNFIGCYNGLPGKNKKIGLLHFDAHLDTEDQYLTMPEVWHGNPFRRLIEEGFLQGKHMVTIGPRDIVPKRWRDYVVDKGINLFPAKTVHQNGIVKIMNEAINLLKDCDYVFVTLDVDCMDISQASGTGTPKQGGLLAQDLILAMRTLNQLPVSGFDLVELNPDLDVSGATSVITCDLLFNFLAFGLSNPKK